MASDQRASLAADHAPAAVRRRLEAPASQSHLRDVVYGAVDGAITTLAVVMGALGAGLSAGIVLILGFANLVADGFSMAVGNFLGTRAEVQRVERTRRDEHRHIDLVPEGEREEVRQIFAAKGFTGEALDHVVEQITADRERWVDTMLTEEHGLALDAPSPWRAGMATFVAFAVAGMVPLLPFVAGELFGPITEPARWSGLFTGLTFVGVGALKARFVDQSAWRSALETVALGGLAASLAWAVGVALGGLR